MKRMGEIRLLNGYYLPDYFSVIIPEETTNLITNPSIENDTTGYTAYGAGVTIERTIAQQRRETASLKINPATGVASGVYYSSITTSNNEAYTFSVDILGVAGHSYSIYFADNAGNRIGSLYRYISNGYWNRISITYYETSGAARRLYVVQDASDAQPFYLDGFQCENKSYPTTYCDGNLEGFVTGETAYRWNGEKHNSTSYRSSTTRSGGKVVNLKEFGFNLISHVGLGMPDPENKFLELADGSAKYQSTGNNVRKFSLIGDIIEKHADILTMKRNTLENALSSKYTAYDQPILLQYVQVDDNGNQASYPVYIKCVFESGLTWSYDNVNGEKLVLSFTMPEPEMWIDLDKYYFLKSNNILVNDECCYQDENGFVGFAINTGAIYATAIDNENGLVYFGGSFTQIGGVVCQSKVAVYNGSSFSPVGTGATNNTVYALEYYNGYLYAGGNFTTIGGFSVNYVAQYDVMAGVWEMMSAGTISGGTPCAYALKVHKKSNGSVILWVGGTFTQIGAAPVTTNCIGWLAIKSTTGYYSGTEFGTGVNSGGVVNAIEVFGDIVYIGGSFTTVSGVTVNNVAWNQTGYALGYGSASGVTQSVFMSTNVVLSLAVSRKGTLVVGGYFDKCAGNTIDTNNFAIWDNGAWSAFDILKNIPYSNNGARRYVIPLCMKFDNKDVLHVVTRPESSMTLPSPRKIRINITLKEIISIDCVSHTHWYSCLVDDKNNRVWCCGSINTTHPAVIPGIITELSNIKNQKPIIINQVYYDPLYYAGFIYCLRDFKKIEFFNKNPSSSYEKLVFDYDKQIFYSTDSLSDSMPSKSSLGSILNNSKIHFLSYSIPFTWMGLTRDIVRTVGGRFFYVTLKAVNLGAGNYRYDIYKDAAMTIQIGHTGTFNAAQQYVQIFEDNNSGLGGYHLISTYPPSGYDKNVYFGETYIYIRKIKVLSLSEALYGRV